MSVHALFRSVVAAAPVFGRCSATRMAAPAPSSFLLVLVALMVVAVVPRGLFTVGIAHLLSAWIV